MILAAISAVLLGAAPGPLDPTPQLAEGPAAAAKAAFDQGRHAEAAAMLARLPMPEAAFLRGRALLEAGAPGEAVRAIAGLEERLPDVADRILLLRGRALEAMGRKREAIKAWGEVADTSIQVGEARLQRARLASSLGDRAEALDALAPLLDLPAPEDSAAPDVGARALLLAGETRASGKAPDPGAARRLFLRCWSEHPLAPESTTCFGAVRSLPGEEGAAPGPADRLRRAEALLEQNRSDAALSLLIGLGRGLPEPAPGEDLACRARSALGRAQRRERNHAKAIAALRPVVDACDDPAIRVRSLYVLAGAAAIAGDRDEAIELYRRLAREFPRHPLADDALFNAADILLRAGREEEALEALAEVARGEGDTRDEARFRLAWLARRDGRLDSALSQLLAIEESERHDDPYEHGRAAYWRARILEGRDEGGAAAARAIYSDLAERYPADYYGLLSRERLGPAAPPLPAAAQPPATPPFDPGPLAGDRHFRAAVALLRMGLGPEAAEELAAVDSTLLESGGDGSEPVLAVADLLDRAGDHRTAHQMLRTRARFALRRAPEGENLRAWLIAYPPAFRREVERFAPQAHVPPELLQALMREESGLDPRAVSPAGAVGLTQLMLPTAQDLARQMRLPRPGRRELMDGALNIRLGARYLGQLIRRFDGSVALALAAYNAGGGAVSRWLEERGDLAVDEFIEEIPYPETRGYVKRVLRSYAAYCLLYGDGRVSAVGPLRIAGESG